MGIRTCAVRYPMLQCKVLPVVSWVPRDTARPHDAAALKAWALAVR